MIDEQPRQTSKIRLLLTRVRHYLLGMPGVDLISVVLGVSSAIGCYRFINAVAPALAAPWLIGEVVSLAFGGGVTVLSKRALQFIQVFHVALVNAPLGQPVAIEVRRIRSRFDGPRPWLEGAGGSGGEIVFLRGIVAARPRWAKSVNCELHFSLMVSGSNAALPLDVRSLIIPHDLKLAGETIVVDWVRLMSQPTLANRRMITHGAQGFQKRLWKAESSVSL